MKKLLAIALALVLSLSLAGLCVAEETIVIGATTTPHAEILEFVADDLAALGYTLDIVIYTEYPLPNPAVADGQLDANYFQHIPYLEAYNATVSAEEALVPVIGVHYEPYGIYSSKITDLSELTEGAKVTVTNDPSNETRALMLLESAGLISLGENVSVNDALTVNDIVDNPMGLAISEIDASQLPTTLDDVDIAVINGNFALDAGLSPASDAIFLEPADGASAAVYANYVVCRQEDAESEWVEALRTVLCSEKVYNFIMENENYAGGVIPFFTIDTEEE